MPRYLRIDESTVRYWLERYETTGDVEVQQKTGRSQSTTEKQDMMIKSMVVQHPTESAGQIAVRLSSKGIRVIESTLRRRFKEAGIQSMKPTAKPLLSNDHIKRRLEWAVQHKEIDWTQVVFTDESSFHMRYIIRRVWKKRGYVSTVKHPVKVHVWSSFCQHGFGKLVLFRQTLNSKLMCIIYKNGLLPSTKRWFGNNCSRWELLEDKDPKHTSKRSKKFKLDNGVQSISWPPQSSDCNPIENV